MTQRDENRHSLRRGQKYAKKTPRTRVSREKKCSQCPCISSKRSEGLNVPFDDHCSRISLIVPYIDNICGGLRPFVSSHPLSGRPAPRFSRACALGAPPR